MFCVYNQSAIAFTLHNYRIRVEIYEKAVQEPDIIPGDTLALRDFLIANLSEKCDITNEDIRYTYGLNLIGQMAFDIQLKPELDKKHKQMKCIADENPMTDEINVRQCVSQRITDHSSKFAVIFGDEDYELISDGDYEQTAAYANLFRDPFTVHLQPKWKENKKMNKFIVDDIEEDENNSQTYFDPKHLTTNGRNTR